MLPEFSGQWLRILRVFLRFARLAKKANEVEEVEEAEELARPSSKRRDAVLGRTDEQSGGRARLLRLPHTNAVSFSQGPPGYC